MRASTRLYESHTKIFLLRLYDQPFLFLWSSTLDLPLHSLLISPPYVVRSVGTHYRRDDIEGSNFHCNEQGVCCVCVGPWAFTMDGNRYRRIKLGQYHSGDPSLKGVGKDC